MDSMQFLVLNIPTMLYLAGRASICRKAVCANMYLHDGSFYVVHIIKRTLQLAQRCEFYVLVARAIFHELA